MKKAEIIFSIIIAVLFFMVLRFMVAGMENTVWRNDNFCELKHGLEERGTDSFFGTYCAEIDYENKEVKKIYYTHEEMMDFCGRIGFFEFNKWGDKCS